MKTKVKIKKKFYYIYKTTNIVNDKFYIGMHSTNDLDNKYLGSGTIIKSAIKKYGQENFIKEILFIVKTKEELIEKERQIVTQEIIDNPLCMNIKLGGGSDHVITITWSDERKQQQSNRVRGENNPIYGRKRTEKEREKISNNHADVSGENNPMYGGHSESTKEKISNIRKQKFLKGELTIDTVSLNIKQQCPYCKIITNKGNLKKWHYEKCKSYKEA